MPPAAVPELALVPIDDGGRAAAARGATARSVVTTPARLASSAASAIDVRTGPGWFDSSWDLRRGCEVLEGWPGDVRLNDWIEGFCRTASARIHSSAAAQSARAAGAGGASFAALESCRLSAAAP